MDSSSHPEIPKEWLKWVHYLVAIMYAGQIWKKNQP